VSRVYVPATRELLAAWHAAGGVPADAERVVAPGDDEDSEYAALMTAADASAELVAGLPDGRRRRVVVVVETDDAASPVTWRDVVAVHVDGDDDADPDDDLAWWATQEVDDLLASL
jgi:subtilisin family serine protease